jgi:uncharacterized repeat protein (TIGR02543 family)
MNRTGKRTALQAVALLWAVTLLLAGCKDLFHPEGPTERQETVTVTFYSDGGNIDVQTKTVNRGDSIGYANMPPEPSKSGRSFSGWHTERDGGGEQFTGITTVSSSLAVYAWWTDGRITGTVALANNAGQESQVRIIFWSYYVWLDNFGLGYAVDDNGSFSIPLDHEFLNELQQAGSLSIGFYLIIGSDDNHYGIALENEIIITADQLNGGELPLGYIGSVSLYSATLSGTINIALNGQPPPIVGITAYPQQGTWSSEAMLNTPSNNASWSLAMPTLDSPTDIFLGVYMLDADRNEIFSWRDIQTVNGVNNSGRNGIVINLGNIDAITMSGTLEVTIDGQKPYGVEINAYTNADAPYDSQIGYLFIENYDAKPNTWSMMMETPPLGTTVYFRIDMLTSENGNWHGYQTLPGSYVVPDSGEAPGIDLSYHGASISAPTGLAVSGFTSDSISLSWNIVNEASSYNVYRSEYSSGPYSHIATVYDTYHIDYGLSVEAAYYYKVAAVSSGGEGPQSEYVQGIIPHYTITFDADGGSPATQTKAVASGESTGSSDMPSAPTKSGFEFGGWHTEANGGGTEFTGATVVTETITVYAKWTTVQYTVTFDADGGSPAAQTKSVASGASIGASNMPTEPVRGGYAFDDWYTETNGGGTEFTGATAVTETITVYARWTVAIMPTTSLQAALDWLDTNAVEDGEYAITLNASEAIAPRTLSYSDKRVRITLKGDTLERTVILNANGSLFAISSGVTLILDNNITLQGRSSNTASLITVEGGTLVMNTGAIINGNSRGSSASTYGGGVYVLSSGTFAMNGGSISGNISPTGGGVYVAGTFAMTGGTISNNTALSLGGGVFINSNGTFSMSSGTISDNAASFGGGAYINSSGTFTMSGGNISDNSASSSGGGVEVRSNGAFIMSGGVLGSNTASSGGGVYVQGTFSKQSGGIIYGLDENGILKNIATGGIGHAVYVSSGSKIRITTAGAGVALNSSVSGAFGGWEIGGSSGISNITHSSVSGGTWALQGDGSRKSPAIGDNGTTKARVNFTSSISNAYITLQLSVSSEASCDFAFISELDNASATYQSGRYNGSVISGSTSVTLTIPVTSAGSHFVDIGYTKDGNTNALSDCAWFRALE